MAVDTPRQQELTPFKIKFGSGGINGSISAEEQPLTDLSDCDGIDFSNDSIAKEGGAAKFNTTPITGSPRIMGLWDFFNANFVQTLVAATGDGKIVTVVLGGIGNTLKTGLGLNKQTVFVEGITTAKAKRLFSFNGADNPQSWDGVAVGTSDMGSAGLTPPAACTVAVGAAGNVDAGNHTYMVTFVNAWGETIGGTLSNQVSPGVASIINGTNVPTGPTEVTARKIYRNKAADQTHWFLVTTINDNATTTFTDNTADAGLGAQSPAANTAKSLPTDWVASKPIAGVQHNGSLYAWTNGHTLYKSKSGNHEDFAVALGVTKDDAAFLSVYPAEGQQITMCISYLGRLYIWKNPFGIYWLDDSDPSVANWKLKKLTGKVGADGPLCGTIAGNDVVFLGSDGFPHLLSAVKEFGDVRDSVVMFQKIAPFLRLNADTTYHGNAIAVFYPWKREFHLAMTQGATINNRRLVLDMHQLDNPLYPYQIDIPDHTGRVMYRWSKRDVISAMTTWKDATLTERVLIGDDQGFVWQIDQTLISKDGNGYNSFATSMPINFFPGGIKRGNLHFLELAMRRSAGTTIVSVDVYFDGIFRYTITFNGTQVISGFILGTSLLGTGTLAAGVGQPFNLKKRAYGSGRRGQLKFYNNDNGVNFYIDSATLWVSPGNMKR